MHSDHSEEFHRVLIKGFGNGWGLSMNCLVVDMVVPEMGCDLGIDSYEIGVLEKAFHPCNSSLHQLKQKIGVLEKGFHPCNSSLDQLKQKENRKH